MPALITFRVGRYSTSIRGGQRIDKGKITSSRVFFLSFRDGERRKKAHLNLVLTKIGKEYTTGLEHPLSDTLKKQTA